ncbi:AhpC/TSA family protein [Pseudoalteromonas sp. SR43-6]|jgi:peroxiredoxin|uniref:peroxiredoxin-like family protein n=1 Tax=Pseudoalteromonas TaxID=53246 RepID=UPI0004083E34|nr:MULTISPECIES: peroxiredoxin-like family protein [Pseudoalteromonas]MBA6408231.1 AhpC/TSA family protein [Pseudoalteromonas sp. 5Ae-yellow]MBB1290430.1 AhpC/TSA family protein [Pseudoalteromonas sp. SR41-5]MBB1372776.1 AhpC/TSA family protein [Pseudoalteromonas sp. SR43-6]MBB1412735.1 AhpC/TSA family protein [Pseudoalteromonas sp. SG43-8]MBD0409570.1 AhpC/TSA family protein [Pseudoalteromonas distincta]|tara:strand:- start:2416 stop:3066 length:651 start_codon:yes stop_codon:yes gene_type:complete
MSLKAQIDAYNVQKDAKLPADVLALMNTTNEELIAQHIKDNALQIGQKVENFSLANHNGENIELADLLKKGPVIISFYRGGWCPYCNLELKALNDYLPQFKTQSAQLIAISPQLPDETLSTAQKNDLEFDVLCDVSNKVAEQFGLLFTLDERIQALYTQFGIDFEHYYGDKSFKLPLPATYVINQEGVITYAFLSEDYTLRAEPIDVMTALESENN